MTFGSARLNTDLDRASSGTFGICLAVIQLQLYTSAQCWANGRPTLETLANHSGNTL